LLSVLALACFAAGCGSGESQSPSDPGEAPLDGGGTDTDVSAAPDAGQQSKASKPAAAASKDPRVLIKTSEGDITVRLHAKKAPRTVDNFLQNYVDRGFYDKTIFHQVEEGFLIVGGAFSPDLEARPTRAPIFNEAAESQLGNRRGTIAMARDPADPHSASNQFFFNLADNGDLDHKNRESAEGFGYCVFGEVVEGVDVLDRIANTPVAEREGFAALPVRTVLIESVRRLR
jgi:peptidyl-prolyl cis-trans isomerase B (cyclophilin B)